jgi:hypothetical protein
VTRVSILWLPSKGVFLAKADEPHVRPHRPLSQGDVFGDVPLYFANYKKGAAREKLVNGLGLLLGHTCSIRGGASLAVLQNVCHVREAKEKELERLTESENTYRQLFPLPDLRAGVTYVADFNQLGTVHFKHLSEKRVACLSHEGWAALHVRYAFHSTRIDQSLDDRIADIRPTWLEVELWEEWCFTGRPEADFQKWLDEPLSDSKGTEPLSRRLALESDPDAVRQDLAS